MLYRNINSQISQINLSIVALVPCFSDHSLKVSEDDPFWIVIALFSPPHRWNSHANANCECKRQCQRGNMATICVSRAHKTMHTPYHTADSSPSASASAHPSHRKPRSREQMCGVLGSRVTDPIQKRAETPRKYLEFSHSMRPYCPLLFSSSPLICFSCIYTNVCVCVCMYMRVVVCGTCICFSFFVFFFVLFFACSCSFPFVNWI